MTQDAGAPPDLAGYIDHTLLKPEATADQVRLLCNEAAEHHFCTVCVNSRFVALAASALSGSGVGVCSVVGFPLGAMASGAKASDCLLYTSPSPRDA